MSGDLLRRAAEIGDKDLLVWVFDEEEEHVNSEDRVSVCVLWLLILLLFGIVWMDCSHLVL